MNRLAGLGTLIKQIAVTVATRVGIVALGFATAAMRGQCLGAEEFGAFAVALLTPVLMTSLLNLGIATANSYFIGRGEVSLRDATALCLRIWAVTSVLGMVIGGAMIYFGGRRWLPGASPAMLWIGLATFPPTLLKDLLGSVLLGAHDVKWFNRAPIYSAIAMLAFTAIALVFDRSTIAGVLVAQLLATALGAAICGWRLRQHLRESDVSTASKPMSYLRRYLSYGWKANLQSFLNYINYRFDIFLLGALAANDSVGVSTGGAAVGAYAATMLFTEKLWLLAQAASSVMRPKLAAEYASGKRHSEITPFVNRWVMFTTILPAALLGTLTGRGLAIVFGEDFAVAGPALAWLLPGAVMTNCARVLTADLQARGRVDLCMNSSFVLVGVNVALNLVLIPKMGITGAAISSTVSYAVRMLIILRAYVKLSGARWIDCFLPSRADFRLATRAVQSFAPRFRRMSAN
jgi:O-antigen/teichoic acid export membrane protein